MSNLRFLRSFVGTLAILITFVVICQLALPQLQLAAQSAAATTPVAHGASGQLALQQAPAAQQPAPTPGGTPSPSPTATPAPTPQAPSPQATAAAKVAKRDVTRIYAELCASCHGPTMTGGQAPSMVDDLWTFGSDDASLTQSIKEGRPAQGMPAWKAALSDQDVRAMVIYIREQGARYRKEHANTPKPALDTVVQSQVQAFKLETVVEGVKTPWSVAFLPDGRMLVTEKAGQLRIVENGTLSPTPISGTPAVWSRGQGGLLDVAVHPDYAKNGWIYLAYSDPGADNGAMTAIVRGKLRDGAFVDQEQIYKAPAELYITGSQVHFGSRIVFDGKGHIYFSIGERGRGPHAQELTRPNGKVHRINEDGSVPKNNPFAKKAPALPTIWSYGNRNPQGLAQHPVTGDLWEVEHGPRGGDELNLIQAGKNYGWPVITYGMNYDGTPMTDKTALKGMQQPLAQWTPSIAVCPIDFYRGDKFPQWKNQLLLGALAGQEVRRIVITNRKVTHQEILFQGVGRVRDLVSAPDGYIYVAFNEPDRIARLVPATSGAPTSASAAVK